MKNGVKTAKYFLIVMSLIVIFCKAGVTHNGITKSYVHYTMKTMTVNPFHPVMAISLAVIKNGQIILCDTVGYAQVNKTLADNDTKYRIASISKLITAIAAWQLIESGKLNPDADVNDYLDVKLRNPDYPDIPITTTMLMSHTSSISDGTMSNEAPGTYFHYDNKNYDLLATVIEKVSGERFDKYMTAHIFKPMELTCSFNISDMDKETQSHIGTLYRKCDSEGRYAPLIGEWTAQADDGLTLKNYDDYVTGTDASILGSAGGLRISINELCQIAQMFMNGGKYNGVEILKPSSVQKIFTPTWTGGNKDDLIRCYGMGAQIFTNTGGDRLVKKQNLPFAGHLAEAHGLLAGFVIDYTKGNGIIYIIAGLGSNPHKYRGDYSALYKWEEQLLTIGAEYGSFEY